MEERTQNQPLRPLKRFIVTEINKGYCGMWQTTDIAYYGECEERLRESIRKSFELNGRDYVIRKLDEDKILVAKA